MADTDVKPQDDDAVLEDMAGRLGDVDLDERQLAANDQRPDYEPAPKKKKSKLSDPKVVGAIGLGAALLILLAILLAFLSLFKLDHIEKLFVAYEFGQFERAASQRTTEALREAEGKAKGTGDETVAADAPLEEQLGKLNARQVLDGTDSPQAKPKFDNGTYEGYAAPDGTPVAIDDPAVSAKLADEVLPKADLVSFESTGGAIATEYGLAGDTPAVDDNKPTGEKKTPEEVEQEVDTAAEKEARGTVEPVPTETLQSEADKAEEDIKKGADPEVAVDSAAERAASKLSKITPEGVINVIGNLTIFCVFYDIVHTSVGKATEKIIHGYMNTASMFYAAADKQKEGKLPAAQVGAYNNFFDNNDPKNPQRSFTDGCGYLRATNQAKRCVPANDLPAADRPFQAQAPQVLLALNKVSNVPGLDKACSVLLDPRVVAAGFGASLILLLDDLSAAAGNPQAVQAIIATAQSAVIKAALFVGGAEGAKYLIKIAMHHYLGTNTAISPKTPVQNGTKVDVGTDLLAQAHGAKSGGRKLKPGEVRTLNDAVQKDRIAYEKRRGLAYRLVNINNPRSVAATFLIQLPSTPRQLMASLTGSFAALTSPVKLASSSATSWLQNTPTALAADDGSDPYGVPHYLLTDNELTKYKILTNARTVEADMKANPDTYKKYDKCFDSKLSDLEDPNTKDEDIKHCRVDPGQDPKLDRYRLYRFDRNVVHNLVLMGNGQPAQ